VYSEFYNAIDKIGKNDWEQLDHQAYPFTRFEFLKALETDSSDHPAACCTESGWQPHHLIIRNNSDEIIAGLPLYLKYHSYGEYIFDWAWADAYRRNGLEYYPKLLAAIPFTPCTGPRLLLKNEIDREQILPYIIDAIEKEAQRLKLSSSHYLFSSRELSQAIEEHGLMLRESVQYHWLNRSYLQKTEDAYADFDDFLKTFKSRKRKAVKRERSQIESQGLIIKRLRGDEIPTELWEDFFHFYQATYAKRSGHGGYLPKHFFAELGKVMAEHIMMAVAYKEGEPHAMAAALYFYSDDTLFGRYWGCAEEAEFLHFELCYYQGIEFCIENKLKRFDAGAQGEHKIQRGFIPIKTYSNHAITNPQFREAIANFIKEEALYNSAYIKEVSRQLPYKENAINKN